MSLLLPAAGRSEASASPRARRIAWPSTAIWPGAALRPPTGVRLWRVDLSSPVTDAERALLSESERARACRFVHVADRRRHEAARAALRQLLAAECGCRPEQLAIATGWAGKPHLESAGADSPQGSFNLSHSGEIALVVWDPAGSDWGVDVEHRRPVEDREAVAEQVFTEAERAELSQAVEQGLDRDRAFLRVWTRKEACLKALGTGFSLEPAVFAAGLGPASVEVRLSIPQALQPQIGAVAVLRVFDLDAGDDAVAAAAIRLDRTSARGPARPTVGASGEL